MASVNIDVLWSEIQNEPTVIRAFTDEQLRELVSYMQMLNRMVDERNEVISLIPECSTHGFCLPHASEWIENQREYYVYMVSGDHSHPLFDITNNTITGTKPVYDESGKQVGILPYLHKITEIDDRRWLTPDEIGRIQFIGDRDKPE